MLMVFHPQILKIFFPPVFDVVSQNRCFCRGLGKIENKPLICIYHIYFAQNYISVLNFKTVLSNVCDFIPHI